MKLKFLTVILIFVVGLSDAADDAIPDPIQRPDVIYRLFRTQNIWTYLKLNTTDGRIWQVSFDLDGDSRGTAILNDVPLVAVPKRTINRFTLYPSKNIFNFILLDQIDGKTWQVQWGFESSNRVVLPIPGVGELY